MRLVDAVAGNVVTPNVINKNDATKSELNLKLVLCSDRLSLAVSPARSVRELFLHNSKTELLVSVHKMIIIFWSQLVSGRGVECFSFVRNEKCSRFCVYGCCY